MNFEKIINISSSYTEYSCYTEFCTFNLVLGDFYFSISLLVCFCLKIFNIGKADHSYFKCDSNSSC